MGVIHSSVVFIGSDGLSQPQMTQESVPISLSLGEVLVFSCLILALDHLLSL